MRRTDLPASTQRLLARSQYATIATVCSNGQPWNTPVAGSFDDDLNLYWVSWRANQHSKNIVRSPRIFVVVYDTTTPTGSGIGLYVQMKAKALETAFEVAEARKWYDTSFFALDDGTIPTFTGACPSRIYKATLQRAWHNTEARLRGHFIDRREEITAKA